MIRIQGTIPRHVTVACSGGVDSMAIVDFLKRQHQVSLAFVHHGDEASFREHDFLLQYADDNEIALTVSHIDTQLPHNTSQEEHWRNERYKVLHAIDGPVITCHHLDDCVETWIFSSMHGNGKIIPYSNLNVIRPFRLNRKDEFISWCRRHNVAWCEDESNTDTTHMRNYIRHEIVDKMLVINPGLHKTVGKKVEVDIDHLI